MAFKITLSQNGLTRKTWHDIPAYKHDNMLRIPDFAVLGPSLAPKEREALQRGEWSIVCSDMLRADLTDKKGKPLGTLFANWD